jgi:hypothetical protein
MMAHHAFLERCMSPRIFKRGFAIQGTVDGYIHKEFPAIHKALDGSTFAMDNGRPCVVAPGRSMTEYCK